MTCGYCHWHVREEDGWLEGVLYEIKVSLLRIGITKKLG